VYEHSKVDFEFEVEPDVPLREVVRDLLGEVIARWRASWCAVGDAPDGPDRDDAFDRWRAEDRRLRRVFALIGADVTKFYETEKFNIAVLRGLQQAEARRWAGVILECEGGARFRALWRGRGGI